MSECDCSRELKTLIQAVNNFSYITENILPHCYDVELNDKDALMLYFRLHNIFLSIKAFKWTQGITEDTIPLQENISQLIQQIRFAATSKSSNFLSLLEKAKDNITLKKTGSVCTHEYSEINSHINKNLIEPVKMLEKEMLKQLCLFIHKTPKLDILPKLFTSRPTINVDLLTNENQQTVIHAISLVGEDDSKLTSACLQYVPFKNLQQFINIQRTNDGNTALHLASENGKRKIVQCLLEHGASTSLTNSLGQTVLDVAANDVITNLIKKATSFDSTNINAQLFDTFLNKSNLEANKLLADTVDLFDAINCSNVAKVKEILKRDNSCVNKKNKSGVSPLIKAIGLDNVDIVRILLKDGADASEFYRGMNSLHWAVKKGDVRVVELCLDYVKDVNVRSQVTGETALHMASENGHVAIVKLLLAHGANFEPENKLKQTPLTVSISDDVSELLTAVSDFHKIIDESVVSGEVENGVLVDILLRAKISNNLDVLTRATNKNGKTAGEVIMQIKGPVYNLFKKLFLNQPEPPDGS